MYPSNQATSYMSAARHFTDIEDGTTCIEIKLERYTPGTMWTTHTEFLYTEPKGNWTSLEFKRFEKVDYIDFLNTMVVMNLQVARKVALEAARRTEPSIRAMKCLEILDSTFDPPFINTRAKWQRELVESLCKDWSVVLISTNKSIQRLQKYQSVLSGL